MCLPAKLCAGTQLPVSSCSFGTSVGSGALTLRRAVVIAAFCEFSGAVTLGAGVRLLCWGLSLTVLVSARFQATSSLQVSDTLVRQISYLNEASCWQCSTPGGGHGLLFMLGKSCQYDRACCQVRQAYLRRPCKLIAFFAGMACALLSGALFLLAATAFGMPVSTTHAVVGAVLGMTAVGAGAACVKWGYPGVLSIVVSWCASPILAGILSAAMHLALQQVVFQVCLLSRPCLHISHTCLLICMSVSHCSNTSSALEARQWSVALMVSVSRHAALQSLVGTTQATTQWLMHTLPCVL